MIKHQNQEELLAIKQLISYKSENDVLEQTEMTDFQTGSWILRFSFKNGKNFQLQAELSKDLKENFKIQSQILKIMQLKFINKVNHQCQKGQFYLNMQSGKLCYKLIIFISTLKNEKKMFASLIRLSKKKIMVNDFKKHLFFIQNKLRLYSKLPFQEQSIQINQNDFYINHQNKSLFNQINEIQINNLKLINKNYFSLVIILKHLDGNLIELKLYKAEYLKKEVEKTNLKKIGFQLQINSNPSVCTFSQYVQVYFYENNKDNDFYYMKNQYYSLEKYLIENSFKISLQTKLLALLSIAQGIHFIHQSGIIHSYINLQSIYITPNNRTIPIISHLEKAYSETIQSSYTYLNFHEYTPPELKNKKLKYPITKTDIYQFGMLMLQFLFEISKQELKNFSLELFKEKIFSSGHFDIMENIYNLLVSCLLEKYFLRFTIEEVIQSLKKIIQKINSHYETENLLNFIQ